MTAPARLPIFIKVIHGLGSVAYGVKDNGFAFFLLIFYNQVIGLDAGLVSAALLLILIADAFLDPIIGHLCDRTYTRWGKRLPWIYIAALPLSIAWIFLWMPPKDNEYIFYYLIGAGIVVRILLSAVEVPSASLVPELTRDYDERTEIMRYRYLFAWAGGLLILFLAYAVFLVPDETTRIGQLNRDGYVRFGIAGGIMIFGAVMLSALGQHRRMAHLPATKPAKTTIKKAFGEIFESLSHPASVILFSGASVTLGSFGMTLSIANYLYLFVWRFPQWAFNLYPLLLFLSVVVAFFAVAPVNARFGKSATVIVTGIIALVFGLIPFLLLLLNLWPVIGGDMSTYLVFFFFLSSNAAAICVLISAQSMVGDIVEASEQITGRRSEGVFSAGWFFTQKCSSGLGIFITGLIISWAGLPTKAVPGSVDGAVITKLIIAYCAAVTISALASFAIFRRFPITRDNHRDRLAQLGHI